MVINGSRIFLFLFKESKQCKLVSKFLFFLEKKREKKKGKHLASDIQLSR